MNTLNTGIRYHDVYRYMTKAIEGEDAADLCATMDWSFVVKHTALLYELCRATVEEHFVVSVAPNPTTIEAIACAAFAQLVKDITLHYDLKGIRGFMALGYSATTSSQTIEIPDNEVDQLMMIKPFLAIINRRRG